MEPNERRIRVLVVDDSATARRLVSQLLSAEPDIEVSGFAENGRLALERVAVERPDAVVLDLEMPEMGGLEALRELKRLHEGLPVLVFSSHTQPGATATIDALLAGADEYAMKPNLSAGVAASWFDTQRELSAKLRTLAQRASRAATPPVSGGGVPESLRPAAVRAPVRAIAIGISSGGPEALAVLLPRLPDNLKVPLFIVQHMPRNFTAALAKRLNEKSKLRVVEAKHGDVAQPGVAYLAPGDQHLLLARQRGKAVMLLDHGPLENGCRPSVDPLFRSAADVYGASLLAVVMTGIGSDGVDGARHVAAAGGHIWIQDRESSAVWGMPGAVMQAGLATRTCDLAALAPCLEIAVTRGLPLRRNGQQVAGQ